MKHENEASKDQHTVANEAVMVSKACDEVVTDGLAGAIQVCDHIPGVVGIIQIRKLTGDKAINLSKADSQCQHCQPLTRLMKLQDSPKPLWSAIGPCQYRPEQAWKILLRGNSWTG